MNSLKENKNTIYIVVIIIAVLAMLVMVFQYKGDRDRAADEAASETSIAQMRKKKLKEPEVKVTVDTQVIEDGLNDMGFLVTQEYYFTQVEKYTKEVKVLGFVPSESEILYSYDGKVYAGVDFEGIEIAKDEESKTLTVTIPPSEIQSVDIDLNTFKVYSEKDHVWNKMQITDYNSSLIEYEKAAKNKALESGILDRADEQAMKLVMNFIRSIPDAADYKVAIE